MSAAANQLLGAAAHALGRADKQASPGLQAQPPRPPLWKRKALYPYIAVVVVVLGLVTFEISLRVRTHYAVQHLEELEREFSERQQLKNVATVQASEGAKAARQVVEREAELQDKTRELAALQRLLARQTLMVELLQALQKSTTDEVLLDTLVQQSGRERQFYVSGWATSNTAAQLLVNNLDRDLKRLAIGVQDSRIQSGSNSLGGAGYKVEVWLRQTEEAPL